MHQNQNIELTEQLGHLNVPAKYEWLPYVTHIVATILDRKNTHSIERASKVLDEIHRARREIRLSDFPYHYRFHISKLSIAEAVMFRNTLQSNPFNRAYTWPHPVMDAERDLMIHFLNLHIEGKNIL
jgi:hypothetical protein